MPIVLALTAAGVWGSADFLGGAASRRVKAVQALLISQASGLIALLAIIPFLPGTPSARDLAWGAVGGLLGNAGLYGLYSELAHGTAGVVAPTTAVSAAVTPVMVGLAMGERPTPVTLAGVVLALVAVALLAGGEGRGGTDGRSPDRGALGLASQLLRRRSFWVALASGLGFGGFFVCLAQTSKSAGLWPLVASRAASLVLLAFIPAAWQGIRRIGTASAGTGAGSGVLDVAANACYVLAIRAGTLTVIPVLASLYPASTVLFSPGSFRGSASGGYTPQGWRWPLSRLPWCPPAVRDEAEAPPLRTALLPRAILRRVKLCTWNVNSVRQRLPRLLAFLEREAPDVVCLQELKCTEEDFPTEEVRAAGYHSTVHGQRALNGVALLSRAQPVDVMRGFDGDPLPEESRLVSATVYGVRVSSVYVVNGKDVKDPAYQAKLEWLEALGAWVKVTRDPSEPVVIMGDFNIGPEDRDVWDPVGWHGRNLVSEPERERFASMLAWGLVDLGRRAAGDIGGPFTFWDYRAGAFHKNWGLRIDLALGTAPIVSRLLSVDVDRNERRQTSGEGKPSDHAPLIVTLK